MQINQSPLATPVLSSGPTATTASTSVSPIHPMLGKYSAFGSPQLLPRSSNESGRRASSGRFPSKRLSTFGGSEWPNGGGGQYDDGTLLRRTQLSRWERAGLARIKSVAPAQTTPPVENSPMRRSMIAVEDEDGEDIIMDFPLSFETNASALRKPARLDSTILGEEDGRLVHGGYF